MNTEDDVQVIEQPGEVQNIDDTLGEVFDRMQADSTDDAPAEQPGQPRDEAGKFATKTVDEPTETPKSKRPRPSMLPQELPWDELPETWQEFYDRREREVAKGFEARAAKMKQFEPLQQALEPHSAKLRATYGDESKAIQHLLSLADFAERDPNGFITKFAAARGLPPPELADVAPQQQARFTDPATAVREEMARIEAQRQFEEFSAQHAQDPFFGEQQITADGEVVYPFRNTMAALLNAGIATDFATAYEMAKYARPDTRQQTIAQAIKDERAKWEAEVKERAKVAQRANAVNVNGKPAPRLPAKGRTMEDTMRETYDRMQA